MSDLIYYINHCVEQICIGHITRSLLNSAHQFRESHVVLLKTISMILVAFLILVCLELHNLVSH